MNPLESSFRVLLANESLDSGSIAACRRRDRASNPNSSGLFSSGMARFFVT